MIKKELLDILVCPETRQELSPAAEAVVEKINRNIEGGKVKNRGGEAVEEKIGGGLVRADGKYLYPIRSDIPIMLIDEAIPL